MYLSTTSWWWLIEVIHLFVVTDDTIEFTAASVGVISHRKLPSSIELASCVTRCDELEELIRGKWKERMKIMNSRVLFSTFFSRLGFSELIARSHFEWRHKEYPVFIIWRPVAHVLPLQGNFLIFWISNKLSEISNKLIDFRHCSLSLN